MTWLRIGCLATPSVTPQASRSAAFRCNRQRCVDVRYGESSSRYPSMTWLRIGCLGRAQRDAASVTICTRHVVPSRECPALHCESGNGSGSPWSLLSAFPHRDPQRILRHLAQLGPDRKARTEQRFVPDADARSVCARPLHLEQHPFSPHQLGPAFTPEAAA